jgi:hypothetical protein
VAGENAMLFRAVQERGGKKYDNKRQISNNQQKEKKKAYSLPFGSVFMYATVLALAWNGIKWPLAPVKTSR